MTDAEKARMFRMQADVRGLTLVTPHSAESRFTFVLKWGNIVTSRHPTQLAELLKLAKTHWGKVDGDYAELLFVSASRDELQTSAPPSNIEWSRSKDMTGRVLFHKWLEDQFLLLQAVQSKVLP